MAEMGGQADKEVPVAKEPTGQTAAAGVALWQSPCMAASRLTPLTSPRREESHRSTLPSTQARPVNPAPTVKRAGKVPHSMTATYNPILSPEVTAELVEPAARAARAAAQVSAVRARQGRYSSARLHCRPKTPTSTL